MSVIYDAKHTMWVEINDVAKVGITGTYLGFSKCGYIELEEVGTELLAGDRFGEIELIDKGTKDIYSPLYGEIVELNDDLLNDPETINHDGTYVSWLIKMQIDWNRRFPALSYNIFRSYEIS